MHLSSSSATYTPPGVGLDLDKETVKAPNTSTSQSSVDHGVHKFGDADGKLLIRSKEHGVVGILTLMALGSLRAGGVNDLVVVTCLMFSTRMYSVLKMERRGVGLWIWWFHVISDGRYGR